METVKQWALTVAISAAAAAVILMLTPDGALNKSVRTAVSLFLMIAMLSPFLKGVDFNDFRIDIEDSSQTDLTDAVEEQMKTAVSEKISEILLDCGIKSEGINIDISVDGETMRVEKIEITARQGGDIERAEKRIRDEIGADVKIGVSE